MIFIQHSFFKNIPPTRAYLWKLGNIINFYFYWPCNVINTFHFLMLTTYLFIQISGRNVIIHQLERSVSLSMHRIGHLADRYLPFYITSCIGLGNDTNLQEHSFTTYQYIIKCTAPSCYSERKGALHILLPIYL